MANISTVGELFKQKLKQPVKLGKRSVLLKGPSGSGKSHQFRKLVEAGWKGLYAHVNEHMGTVEDLFFIESPLAPDYFPITTYDIPLMPSDKNVEKQDFMLMMDMLRTPDHPYDFVFLDSSFELANALEDHLRYKLRLSGYDLWGMFGHKMRRALNLLVSLSAPNQSKPLDVITTWGVEVSQNWEGQRSKEPIIDGKMVGPHIPYKFDDVFMLGKRELPTGEVEYHLYTGGTHEFDGKVSTGTVKLPHKILDPDLSRIIRLLRGEVLPPRR